MIHGFSLRRELAASALIVGVVFALGTLSACGEMPETSADAVIVDVRTPEEYAGGHLEGAQNIDFYAPDFVEQVSQLDRNKQYRLYCRSGSRAGQAEQLMKDTGFNDVASLGSMQTAANATGKEIVQ